MSDRHDSADCLEDDSPADTTPEHHASLLVLALVTLVIVSALALLILIPSFFDRGGIGRALVWGIGILHLVVIRVLAWIDPVHSRTVVLIPLATLVPFWVMCRFIDLGFTGATAFVVYLVGWLLFVLSALEWHKRMRVAADRERRAPREIGG